MPRTHRAISSLLAFAPCVAVGAQIPAHATLLSAQYQLLEPVVLQRGDVVHVFTTTFSAPTFAGIHWRSDDGGRTWPIREQLLTPANVATLLEDVDVGPGRALAIYGDRTAGPMLLRSVDEGTTWSAPIAVAPTVTPQPLPLSTDMHVAGQLVVAAWTNDRASGRVFANRSTDGGLTWQPTDVQLDVGAVSPPATISRVRCVGAGNVVHVLWTGLLPSGGAYATFHQRSLDGGVTWRPTPVVVTGTTGRVATDGANVIAVADQGALRRSGDFGDTWTQLTNVGIGHGTDVRNEGSTFVVAGDATIATAGVYVVNASTDGGQTWLANPLQLIGIPLVVPRVHFGGGRIWVRFLNGTLFNNVVTSHDVGHTWQTVFGPVNAGFGASERRTIHVAEAQTPNGARLHAYVATGNSTLGAATTGTGGVAPSLTTIDPPLRGRSTTFRVDGAVGGSIGILGASSLPPTPWPFGNATVWLGGTPTVVGFATSGATGAPGAGSFGLTCAIPNSLAVVGTSSTAQALVLDAGSPVGFTVTNAIEVWLR
jgi:hypothetical protein